MSRSLLALSLAAMLALTACGGGTPSAKSTSTAAAGDPRTDKLANVLARGTLVLSTDPEYPPQSSLVKDATRVEGTRCAANQLTKAEVEGMDVDTGVAVAEALGVEPCFVPTPFNEITAGNWNDRWDVSWGSGALTEERMERLYVTQPYYSTPHNFFVPADSKVKAPEELSGQKVGACAGCTHELYLQHALELPGDEVTYVVDDPEIVTFEAEPPGLKAAAKGKLAAFLCGEPVGQAEIDNGLALRMLAKPAFVTQKTGYLDKGSTLSQTAFAERIDGILLDLHEDGTLAELSEKYFDTDYATAAAQFDMAALDQQVE